MSQPIEAQIHTALLSYCRGIDRLRPEDVLAAFHPDADLRYGSTPVTPAQFSEAVMDSLQRRYAATRHQISNTRIEVDPHDSSRRRVETYVTADHLAIDDDGERELHTFYGRYIDTFSCRDDQWRIAVRQLCCDFSARRPLGPEMKGSWTFSGRGEDADPLFA